MADLELSFVQVADTIAGNGGSRPVKIFRYTWDTTRQLFQILGCKPRHAQSLSTTLFRSVQAIGNNCINRTEFNELLLKCLAEKHYFPYLGFDDVKAACSLKEQRTCVIVLLAGTSGTGKSTLATLLATRLGIKTVISTDTIRHIIRSFHSKEDFPFLYASTYQAGEAFDTSRSVGMEHVSHSERVIKGYAAQSEIVVDYLDRLIAQYVARNEPLVCEGVHLNIAFIIQLMQKYDCIVPFLVFIGQEKKHIERMAVRARDMTVDPAKNKYVAHMGNIRLIQDYLRRKADAHEVPQVDNSNIDASVEVMHTTLRRCLKLRLAGEALFDVASRTARPIYCEYVQAKDSIAAAWEAHVNKHQVLEELREAVRHQDDHAASGASSSSNSVPQSPASGAQAPLWAHLSSSHLGTPSTSWQPLSPLLSNLNPLPGTSCSVPQSPATASGSRIPLLPGSAGPSTSWQPLSPLLIGVDPLPGTSCSVPQSPPAASGSRTPPQPCLAGPSTSWQSLRSLPGTSGSGSVPQSPGTLSLPGTNFSSSVPQSPRTTIPAPPDSPLLAGPSTSWQPRPPPQQLNSTVPQDTGLDPLSSSLQPAVGLGAGPEAEEDPGASGGNGQPPWPGVPQSSASRGKQPMAAPANAGRQHSRLGPSWGSAAGGSRPLDIPPAARRHEHQPWEAEEQALDGGDGAYAGDTSWAESSRAAANGGSNGPRPPVDARPPRLQLSIDSTPSSAPGTSPFPSPFTGDFMGSPFAMEESVPTPSASALLADTDPTALPTLASYEKAPMLSVVDAVHSDTFEDMQRLDTLDSTGDLPAPDRNLSHIASITDYHDGEEGSGDEGPLMSRTPGTALKDMLRRHLKRPPTSRVRAPAKS